MCKNMSTINKNWQLAITVRAIDAENTAAFPKFLISVNLGTGLGKLWHFSGI